MHSEHFPTDEAGSAAKLNPDVGWGLGGGPGPRGSGWLGGLRCLGAMQRGKHCCAPGARLPRLLGRAGSRAVGRAGSRAGSIVLWPNQ